MTIIKCKENDEDDTDALYFNDVDGHHDHDDSKVVMMMII